MYKTNHGSTLLGPNVSKPCGRGRFSWSLNSTEQNHCKYLEKVNIFLRGLGFVFFKTNLIHRRLKFNSHGKCLNLNCKNKRLLQYKLSFIVNSCLLCVYLSEKIWITYYLGNYFEFSCDYLLSFSALRVTLRTVFYPFCCCKNLFYRHMSFRWTRSKNWLMIWLMMLMLQEN